MTSFDASMAYYDEGSPTMKSYRSYTCSSRNSYLLPDRGGDLRSNKFRYPWCNNSQDKFFDRKPPQISQLRNILSETISNITKNSDLKSDESVQLTLEVELVKRLTTPTNSLVEVTIIQHKPDENRMIGKRSENEYRVCGNSSCSDCPSQKKRNWFERVIKRYYDKSPNKLSLEESHEKKQSKKIQLAPITDNTIIHSQKSNFVKILSKGTTDKNDDSRKNYRKVPPTMKTDEDRNSGEKKKSLVKKLSEMFLMTNKENTNKDLKSALSNWKEVDHMMSLAERKRGIIYNKKTTPDQKIGNLVSNIVSDVLENCNQLHASKKVSVPINYQSFQEPVVTNKTKKNSKTKMNPKHNLGKKNLRKMSGLSLSDTCLTTSKYISVIKSSSSMQSFCSRQKTFRKKKMTHHKESGDLAQFNPRKQTKDEKPEILHGWNISEKGDGKRHKRYKVSSKHCLKKTKNNKKLNNKYSAIEWNGQKYEVNKGVKVRIEQIILNELQNLALKEGMECDVSPLPSTDNSEDSFKSMEKISSFICELDISDKQFQEVKRCNSKSLKTNPSFVIEKKRSGKNLKRNHIKRISRAKNIKAEKTNNPEKPLEYDLQSATPKMSRSMPETKFRNKNRLCEVKPMISQKPPITEDGFEIKYINNNTRKWSDESIGNKKSEVTRSNELSQNNQEESHVTDLNGLTYTHVSSGFVRRIESNDSSWNDFEKSEVNLTTNQLFGNALKLSTKLVEVDKTRKKTISATSNESENHVQIELDLEGLETILNEAKKKQDCGKVVLNAKCKRGVKNKARSRVFTGKNSTSYTDHLLIKAAQQLEKYRREKLTA